MKEKLFVYGTLKRGQKSPLQERMENSTTFISEATVNGNLYMVTYYPALSLECVNSTVHGEVFEIDDQALLNELDEYEGICNEPSAPNEYRRELIDVTLKDQSTVKAWAYIYNWSTENLKRIGSGNFTTN
jgi:gamma-glutamylcyclotransferase (GGCT)/AIG2-like uncharacterized protein YtfP